MVHFSSWQNGLLYFLNLFTAQLMFPNSLPGQSSLHWVLCRVDQSVTFTLTKWLKVKVFCMCMSAGLSTLTLSLRDCLSLVCLSTLTISWDYSLSQCQSANHDLQSCLLWCISVSPTSTNGFKIGGVEPVCSWTGVQSFFWLRKTENCPSCLDSVI